MKHRTLLAVALAALSAGCVSTRPSSTPHAVIGTWGESHADCRDNPHTISFSSKDDRMRIRYRKGGTADGESLQKRFAYRVIGKRDSGLRLALIGETRKDSFGYTVKWEFRQPDKDTVGGAATGPPIPVPSRAFAVRMRRVFLAACRDEVPGIRPRHPVMPACVLSAGAPAAASLSHWAP